MDIINKLDQCISENKIEEAVDIIINEYQNYKDNVLFLNLKAITCIKIGEYESAISDLIAATKLSPKYANTYFNLAYVYEIEGDHSKAALYYGYAQKYSDDKDLIQELEQYYQEIPSLKQIQEIIAKGKKKHFIILSSCGWANALQRMQHIARSLVKLDQRVTYICPEIEIDLSSQLQNTILVQEIIDSVYSQMMEHTLNTTKRVIDGVEVYTTYRNILDENHIISNYRETCQKIIDNNHDVVIVSYLPSQINVIDKLKGDFKVIYECVDDHLDRTYVNWGSEQDALLEHQLKERADAITTTATALYLRNAVEEKRKNVFLSRNAVTYSDFITKEDYIPEDIKHIPSPRIIYTGAIYEWFDMELFNKIVESNPDKSFIIIGFGKKELFSKSYSNLYLLGEKKHSELAYYLKQCDAAIIPFKDDIDLIVNCDPIKHYEYIMCGLPVITTYIPECIIGKPHTYCMNSVATFDQCINEILQRNNEIDLISFSIENSWLSRAALLYDLVNDKQYVYEVKEQIEMISKQLEEVEGENAILRSLWSKCLLTSDAQKALEIAKYSYEKLPIHFTEQNYLFLLAVAKNEEEMFQLVLHAKHIDKPLVEEYIYQYQFKKYHLLHILRLLMKKAYMDVIREQAKLRGVMKIQILAYCYYQLGEKEEANKIMSTLKDDCLSPLGRYLKCK